MDNQIEEAAAQPVKTEGFSQSPGCATCYEPTPEQRRQTALYNALELAKAWLASPRAAPVERGPALMEMVLEAAGRIENYLAGKTETPDA